MTEITNTPLPPDQPEGNIEFPEQTEDISVSDAMTGVLTEPTETFEAVRTSRKKNYWILPMVLLIIITVIATFIVINDEELYTEIKTMQNEAASKRLDEAVKSGTMTKEQRDEQMEQMDKFFDKSSPLFYVTTLVGPIFGVLIAFFIRGLVLWGSVKIFGGVAFYTKILSVLGLAVVIDIIQSIINTVLAVITGKLMVNLGPALFITKEDVGEKLFNFLVHFDVLNFWWIYLVGIGIAIVSGIKKPIGLVIVIALWLIWSIITSVFNLNFGG